MTAMTATLLLDEEITIPHPHNPQRNPTTLHARVVEGREDNLALVVMTECVDNHGLSIANGSEAIATALLRRFALSTATTTFIEHFPYTWDSHHYYLVAYTWKDGAASRRVGKRITIEQVEQLCRLDTCPDCGRGPAWATGGCYHCTPTF